MPDGNDSAKRRTPVMADVARLASVSHQTVSRVLNSHPSVTPTTRARVEAAILQLGYRRNTAARTLVTRSSRTLGVVTVDTSHYGPSSTLFAIEGAARRAGYFVNFVSIREIDRQHMAEAVQHLIAAGVDGLIAIAPLRSAVDALRDVPIDVPLVELTTTDLFAESGVFVDQRGSGAAATRHLLDLGHQTVVHLAGPTGWLEAEERLQGWEAALSAAGRPIPPVVTGDWSARSGYEAGLTLRDQVAARDVTAIFAANDQMALGLTRALQEVGLVVPIDVSIVGFDDIPEAAYFSPALTTVRQDFGEVGRRCIETVLAMIAGQKVPPRPPIRPELLVRDSTAAPRTALATR